MVLIHWRLWSKNLVLTIPGSEILPEPSSMLLEANVMPPDNSSWSPNPLRVEFLTTGIMSIDSFSPYFGRAKTLLFAGHSTPINPFAHWANQCFFNMFLPSKSQGRLCKVVLFPDFSINRLVQRRTSKSKNIQKYRIYKFSHELMMSKNPVPFPLTRPFCFGSGSPALRWLRDWRTRSPWSLPQEPGILVMARWPGGLYQL